MHDPDLSCCYIESWECPYDCYENEDECAMAGGWPMYEYTCDSSTGGGTCCYVEPPPEPCPYECMWEDECWGSGGWVEYGYDCGDEGLSCCYVEEIPEPCPYTCIASFICDWFGTTYSEYSCDYGVCCDW